MQARLGTIVCKFGGDPAISVVEEANCAKFTEGETDRQRDGRRTPHDCISSWNELKMAGLILGVKPNVGVYTMGVL